MQAVDKKIDFDRYKKSPARQRGFFYNVTCL